MAKHISSGVVHILPPDLKKVLASDSKALAAWEDITPLARNEWICWIESVKRPETRQLHVERTHRELKEGKRRPCCWVGCRHATTAMSAAARLRSVAARLTHGRRHR